MLAAFVVAPSSASAVDKSVLGAPPQRIVGDFALVQDSLYKLSAVNLRTGNATVLATPTEYVDRHNAVFENGYLAATGESIDEQFISHSELFSSGSQGPKTLAPWPRGPETFSCRSSWHPLSVDARGRVTALYRSRLPGTKPGSCTVNLSETALVRFDPDGSKKSLYFPDKYKRWLAMSDGLDARFDFTPRGERLAILQIRPRYRVAVLNLSTRTTTEFAPESRTIDLAFVSPRSLLLTRHTGSKTVAKRVSTAGRAGRTIYAAEPATVTACGKFTAIGTQDWIKIRDEKGKTAFRRNRTNSALNELTVTCSGSFLHYAFAEELCSRCGDIPPESKLVELGKL